MSRSPRPWPAAVADLGAVWLSNEAPGVVLDSEVAPDRDGAFALVRDGTTSLAFADGDGTWLQWLAGESG